MTTRCGDCKWFADEPKETRWRACLVPVPKWADPARVDSDYTMDADNDTECRTFAAKEEEP
jgi:hypothetical protein